MVRNRKIQNGNATSRKNMKPIELNQISCNTTSTNSKRMLNYFYYAKFFLTH